MNEVFQFKKIIHLDFLDKVLKLENQNPDKPFIWDLITVILEMIRRTLKWSDLFKNQSRSLV